jgi:hypothetical protein
MQMTKQKLDVDSPEIVTGGFHRAKLIDNSRCLLEINDIVKWCEEEAEKNKW